MSLNSQCTHCQIVWHITLSSPVPCTGELLNSAPCTMDLLKPPPNSFLSQPQTHCQFTCCIIPANSNYAQNFTSNYKSRLEATKHLHSVKPQRPLSKNTYNASPLWPWVPADRQILLWMTSHSKNLEAKMNSTLLASLHPNIFKNLLDSIFQSTQESYGAGLLCFT